MCSQAIRSHCLVFSLLATALAAPAAAQAQDQAGALEEVVVTGTAAGAEIRKLDASFAITTIDDQAITEFSPIAQLFGVTLPKVAVSPLR